MSKFTEADVISLLEQDPAFKEEITDEEREKIVEAISRSGIMTHDPVNNGITLEEAKEIFKAASKDERSTKDISVNA